MPDYVLGFPFKTLCYLLKKVDDGELLTQVEQEIYDAILKHSDDLILAIKEECVIDEVLPEVIVHLPRRRL